MKKLTIAMGITAILFVHELRANVMTFDPLPADFAEITTYTEDNITLFATDGGTEHFHTIENPNNLTTAAEMFASDGTPHRITFGTAGQSFSLIGLDVLNNGGTTTFTSSSGAVQVVAGPGPLVFGPGFSNILFVQMDLDSFIDLDNITATPEPSSLALLTLGALGLIRRRARRV